MLVILLILLPLETRALAAGALRRLYFHHLLPYPSTGKMNFDFDNMFYFER